MNQLSSWLLRKLGWALLLVGLGLTGVGLALFWADHGSFDQGREATTRALTGEIARLNSSRAGLEARLAAGHIELAAQRQRAAQAAKVAIQLEDLSAGFNRLTTSSEQLRENDEGRDRMRQMVADSGKRAAEIEQSLVRTQWEKDGLEIALDRSQRQLADATARTSPWIHYAQAAWDMGGNIVMGSVAVVLILPVFWRKRRTR